MWITVGQRAARQRDFERRNRFISSAEFWKIGGFCVKIIENQSRSRKMHGVFLWKLRNFCENFSKIDGFPAKTRKSADRPKPRFRKPLSSYFDLSTTCWQPVQSAEIRSEGQKKCLTKSDLYRIINIVSYYADRQRHMPASCAGPMPVPICKF